MAPWSWISATFPRRISRPRISAATTRDQARVAKVWARREGPARFTLPLGAPGTPLPEGKDFGARWTVGDDLGGAKNHSGADYLLAAGSPVAAVADGTVVIAEDLFFTGKAVSRSSAAGPPPKRSCLLPGRSRPLLTDATSGGGLAHGFLTRPRQPRKIAPGGRMGAPGDDVTELLRAWGDGDLDARDRLLPLVYQELRRRAAAHLRRERRGHSLQPTDLVHEAYLRLIDQRSPARNRGQFYGLASQMMRRILVDRARANRRAKRSGQWARVTLAEATMAVSPADVDVLDLDDALTRLAAFDVRKSRIAELRFFGGLSLEETGEALGLSVATVERDWQAARAWLFKTLSGRANDA
jgi:RNA polymerase sigma factor (TIGR02999 family)